MKRVCGFCEVFTFRVPSCRILSVNAQGLRGYEKRSKFASHFLYPNNVAKKPQVVCIQESHATPEMEQEFLQSFQYDLCFGSSGNNRAGGLITGFQRNLDYGVTEHTYVHKHRSEALIIYCTIDKKEFVIANVYMHPDELYEEVIESLIDFKLAVDKYNCVNVIWCGDFNCTFSDLDVSTPDSPHWSRRRGLFEHWTETAELSDVFRTFFPETRRYTCFSRAVGSRLDYFMVSLGVLNIICKIFIDPSFLSDHAPQYMEFSLDRNPKGPNYWKFSPYLLHCNEFVDQMREEIPKLEKKYSWESNPHLTFDMVKVGIQQFTRRYIKNKNILKKEQIERVEAKLSELQYKIVGATPSVRHALEQEKEELQEELNTVHSGKWRDYFIGRMQHCNEKSSKSFFQKVNCIPGAMNLAV